MRFNKTHLFVFLAGAILGLCTGFFSGKAIYDKPIEESVSRDTVTLHDTIPDIAPTPKDSAHIKWVTRWLPRDTSSRVDHFIGANNMVEHFADTSKMIPVEVPITSKHYSSKDYDAWVSGFEPSLDSIKVYKETQVITETITRMKPPNKWELDLTCGIDYNFTAKKYTPHVGGELMYKPNRLQVGIRGGIEYNDKVEPFVGAVAKIRIM
jgi:hypothetical protein